MNPLMRIMRGAFGNKKNILCAPTHERYQSCLKDLPYNFYMLNDKDFVKWNKETKIPNNHYLINSYPRFGVDIVFSQNKFGQFQKLAPFAQMFNLPLISLEHTLPVPDVRWQENIEMCRQMRGTVNVFISEYSRNAWGFNEKDSIVIKHTVDDNFKNLNIDRDNVILTVANDYINRDMFLNFKQYLRVTKNLPVRRVGNTPGFSEAAKSIDDLVNIYNSSSIFLNTANVSPIPMSLLEAMACGNAVVSCKTAAIPEYITHGETGFLCESDEEMRYYLEYLLNNKDAAKEIGYNASKSIQKICSKENFYNSWNQVFRSVL